MRNRLSGKKPKKKIKTKYVLFFVLGFAIGALSGFSTMLGFMPEPVTETQTVFIPPTVLTGDANIIGVNEKLGIGVLGKVNVEIADGNHRVLVHVHPNIGIDMQDSAERAVKVAEEYTGKVLENSDIILDIYAGNATIIDGASAGAAISLAVISTIQGTEVMDDAVVTGAIEEDGGVSSVGALLQKMAGAANDNMTLFVLPESQINLPIYQVNVTDVQAGPYTLQHVDYIETDLNLTKIGREEYNITVSGAKDIEELVSLMIVG
jgi:predicted S18 family serine protease